MYHYEKKTPTLKGTLIFFALLASLAFIVKVANFNIQQRLVDSETLHLEQIERIQLMRTLQYEMQVISNIQLKLSTATSRQEIEHYLRLLNRLIISFLEHRKQLQAFTDKQDDIVMLKLENSIEEWMRLYDRLFNYTYMVVGSKNATKALLKARLAVDRIDNNNLPKVYIADIGEIKELN